MHLYGIKAVMCVHHLVFPESAVGGCVRRVRRTAPAGAQDALHQVGESVAALFGGGGGGSLMGGGRRARARALSLAVASFRR